MKKQAEPQKNGAQQPEIHITIHYTEDGPSLNDCMIAILSAHLSKSTVF